MFFVIQFKNRNESVTLKKSIQIDQKLDGIPQIISFNNSEINFKLLLSIKKFKKISDLDFYFEKKFENQNRVSALKSNLKTKGLICSGFEIKSEKYRFDLKIGNLLNLN